MQKNYGSIDEMMGHIKPDAERLQQLLKYESQVKQLANYLMKHHAAEIGMNESAADIAIRLLSAK